MHPIYRKVSICGKVSPPPSVTALRGTAVPPSSSRRKTSTVLSAPTIQRTGFISLRLGTMWSSSPTGNGPHKFLVTQPTIEFLFDIFLVLCIINSVRSHRPRRVCRRCTVKDGCLLSREGGMEACSEPRGDFSRRRRYILLRPFWRSLVP